MRTLNANELIDVAGGGRGDLNSNYDLLDAFLSTLCRQMYERIVIACGPYAANWDIFVSDEDFFCARGILTGKADLICKNQIRAGKLDESSVFKGKNPNYIPMP